MNYMLFTRICVNLVIVIVGSDCTYVYAGVYCEGVNSELFFFDLWESYVIL